ncbi:MAG: hypothetical protein KME09_14755 [Pleurocapsa minor HA4230-MV1]|jgi:hypothetical protein|nr:hypothetical protein [Pleurocapsa minor HA4230-MV1]
MNKPLIEPCLKLSGSAFQGNTLNSTRPLSRFEDRDSVKIVKLTDLCRANFITIDVGYRLIKLKYLIAFRRHHVWWVTCNPLCKQELLDYLGIEQLLGDVEQ